MSDATKWAITNAKGAVRIEGGSDDICSLLHGIDDEIGCFDSAVVLEFGDTDDGGVRVIVEYAPKHVDVGAAVWRIGVEPLDEDAPLIPCRFDGIGGCGYTPSLVVECPPNTPVRWKVVRS